MLDTTHDAPPRNRARTRVSLWCLPAWLAATLLLTWPLAPSFGRFIPTVLPLPDALLQAFLLHWDLRTLFTHPSRVWDAPIFHPERNTLTYTDHHLAEAVLVKPVTWLTSNTAVPYNVLIVLTFVASAWTMYRLVRLLGAGRDGAFVASLLFAFCPYRWCNMGNLNQLHTAFVPLAVFFALRLVHSGRTRDLVGCALTLVATSYFSWYYAFYVATVYAVVALHQAFVGRVRLRAVISPAVIATAAASVLLVLPGVLPYLSERAHVPGFERTLGMASYWSADLLDYIRTNVENRTIGRIPALRGDQPYFPGLLAAALAVVAWLELRRRPRSAGSAAAGALAKLRAGALPLGDASILAAVGITGFVLSLGPILRVAGHRLWIPLPYALLWYVVPGFQSMRASGRYSLLVVTAVAALAGLGYETLRRRGTGGRALFPATVAAALALAWSVPWPLVPFPQRDELPPVVTWLEHQPDDPPVLNLPMPATEPDEGMRDVTRQVYAIYHRKPLVDGASGFVPLPHRRLRQIMQRFPAPESLREAGAFGTRLIVVHYGDWDAAAAARIRAAAAGAPELRPVAAFGDDVVYELKVTGAPS